MLDIGLRVVDANWRTGVDESGLQSGDPLGPGAIGHTRAGKLTAHWRVVSSIPGKNVDWELIGGPYKGHGGYRFVPVEGRPEFSLVAEVEPSGWLKLLGPVVVWIGRRQNQADVERLRTILESTPDREVHT